MSEGSKRRLRMWVRLLAVTRRSENRLREFLRLNHHTTLPRFRSEEHTSELQSH